jgi:hydrogenase-4 component B
MLLGMSFLSGLAILFGMAAGAITPWLTSVVEAVRMSPHDSAAFGPIATLPMVGVALALVGAMLGVFLLVRLSGRRVILRRRTWDCGAPLTARMEITATGFSRSLITIFRGLLRPSTQKQVEYHDASMRYFTKAASVQSSLPDLYRAYLYAPATGLIERGARGARRIQTGNLSIYLLYISVTLAILLTIALH